MSVAHHPNEVGGRSQGDQPNPGQEPPTGDGAHQATTQGPAAFSGDLSRFASVSGGSPSSTQIPDALPSTTAGGAERADTRPTDNSAFGRVALPPTPPVAATAQAHKRNKWIRPAALVTAVVLAGIASRFVFDRGGDSDATAKNPTGGDQPAATSTQFPNQEDQSEANTIVGTQQQPVVISEGQNPPQSPASQAEESSKPEADDSPYTEEQMDAMTLEEFDKLSLPNKSKYVSLKLLSGSGVTSLGSQKDKNTTMPSELFGSTILFALNQDQITGEKIIDTMIYEHGSPIYSDLIKYLETSGHGSTGMPPYIISPTSFVSSGVATAGSGAYQIPLSTQKMDVVHYTRDGSPPGGIKTTGDFVFGLVYATQSYPADHKDLTSPQSGPLGVWVLLGSKDQVGNTKTLSGF